MDYINFVHYVRITWHNPLRNVLSPAQLNPNSTPVETPADQMKIVKSELGEFEIHNRYVIARFKEGMELGFEHVPEISKLLLEHCDGTSVGWIGDRINDYSFDPLAVQTMFDRLPSIASWCNVMRDGRTVDLQPYVAQMTPPGFPAASFKSLDKAIEWTLAQSNR